MTVASEYAAYVTQLPELTALENCDNVAGARFFGLQAIVSKDSVPGTMGIVFQAETQLSPEFLRENNLYRDGSLNKDPNQRGYFEPNGRVRAVKFRGHRSDCFWLPLTSLSYIANYWHVEAADTFEELNGHEICRKYIPKGAGRGPNGQKVEKAPPRVSEKFFPQHLDTSNFFRNRDRIPDGALGIVTQKLHGTSVRIGRVPVPQKLGWLARIAKRFGVPVQDTAYELIAGSRRMIKDAKKQDGGFYDTDIYTLQAEAIGWKIPEGYVVYGELIGWTPGGQPIQRGYTYRVPHGEMDFYAYRVAFVNPQGILMDLSWEALKTWCVERMIKHVPELATGPIDSANIEGYMDTDLCREHSANAVPLELGAPCDEGVCVRIEGLYPEIFKAKSPLFLQHETKLLDKGELDLETVG